MYFKRSVQLLLLFYFFKFCQTDDVKRQENVARLSVLLSDSSSSGRPQHLGATITTTHSSHEITVRYCTEKKVSWRQYLLPRTKQPRSAQNIYSYFILKLMQLFNVLNQTTVWLFIFASTSTRLCPERVDLE